MNSPARCLTGSERSSTALARRLEAHAGLHEVRLDLLDEIDDDTFALLRRHGPRLVVTCRAAAEGGGFDGGEAERLQVLARAARAGIAWLDLELFLFEQGATSRLALDEDRPRLIASLHDFEGAPGRGALLAARFDGCRADLAKLAVKVDGPGDLAELRQLVLPCRDQVVIGMGEAGVWSRVRPSEFGSRWTYVTTTADRATAPGQLTEELAGSLRLDGHRGLSPLALLGDGTIRQSPGPRVYNALFRELDLPYQYLPLPSAEAPGRASLATLGVAGMSVAAPYKASLLAACQEIGPWARRCAAINTIQRLDDGRWKGSNTDAPAVLSLLGDHLRPDDRVLVLGTGATARAAGAALATAGARVSLATRRGRRAEEANWSVVDWSDVAHSSPDVLVNCTPLGGRDDRVQWPLEIDARVVLDMVLRVDGATSLVERARARGCLTFTGQQLWCHQGARQMSLLTGREITPAMLRRHLDAAGWEI